MSRDIQRAGNLEVFASRLNYYQSTKSTFIVRSSGLSRKICFANSNKVWRFFGGSHHSYVDGSYFTQLVRKQIDSYIDKYGIVPTFDKPDIQLFNVPAIKSNLKKPVVAVDINACHWTTAYHLGFISQELFERGLQSGKKKGLLVAIGALNKLEQVDYYEGGVLVKTEYDLENFNRYSPFYWAVIQRVRDTMMRAYEHFEDDLYMWLTDCVFTNFDSRAKAQQFLSELGYNSKFYYTDFVKIDPVRVYWYEPKKQTVKYVGYKGRDITSTYPLWKISNY